MRKLFISTSLSTLFSFGLFANSSSQVFDSGCELLAFEAVEGYFNQEGDNADGFIAGQIFERTMFICELLQDFK